MTCRKFTIGEAVRLRLRVRVPESVSDAEWRRGLNTELEHADVTRCAPLPTARIAAVHFRERPDYYRMLRRYVER
jgi:hypothetical protein